jgi:hypothetical protein
VRRRRAGQALAGGWAAAPAGVHVTGIELMPHDIKRCEIALGGARPSSAATCARSSFRRSMRS